MNQATVDYANINRDVLLPKTITSHRLVTEAICNRDPEAAEQVMRRHLMEELEEVKKAQEEYTEIID